MAETPKLTIGMATHDDFYGVWSTVTSLLTHHLDVYENKDLREQTEIIVVDNAPDTAHGDLTRRWIRGRTPAHYVAFPEPKGTAQPRNEVFRRARGEFVLCVDPHVFLFNGAIRKLVEFITDARETLDLFSGPLITDSGTSIMGTHQRPKWGGGAYGVWTKDPRGLSPDDEPFEIWQQGMGLFAMRREAWPGFHPDFRGFGGCETYVMETVRRNGGKVVCLPWLRWNHRFPRVEGDRTDKPNDTDKLRNYLIGWLTLGWDIAPVVEHFKASPELVGSLLADVEHVETTSLDPSVYVAPPRNVAVVGRSDYGAVKMRGVRLAKEFGFDFFDGPPEKDYDAIVLVKSCHCRDLRQVRERCSRLIVDPLDSFYSHHRQFKRSAEYWRHLYDKLRFDELVATSPACEATMREACPSLPIHLVPHHSDPTLVYDWYDPNGPIAYAGQRCFIKESMELIDTACKAIGRHFEHAYSPKIYRGAALVLSLRCPPYDTDLNRHCKPQVKLENAAACGLPVLSTDDPAAVSLRPELVTVDRRFSLDTLVLKLLEALQSLPLNSPYTEQCFFRDMEIAIYGHSEIEPKPLIRPNIEFVVEQGIIE